MTFNLIVIRIVLIEFLAIHVVHSHGRAGRKLNEKKIILIIDKNDGAIFVFYNFHMFYNSCLTYRYMGKLK